MDSERAGDGGQHKIPHGIRERVRRQFYYYYYFCTPRYYTVNEIVIVDREDLSCPRLGDRVAAIVRGRIIKNRKNGEKKNDKKKKSAQFHRQSAFRGTG